MAKRTKVPRASLACTILDDPEYVGLVMTQQGREALALWTALLCCAKVQDNGGRFATKDPVLAALIRWPIDAFRRAIATLCDATNWVEYDHSDEAWVIRSYAKWNAWGGNRDGAGRKSSCNQDGIKCESKGDVPASDSVTDTNYTTTARESSLPEESAGAPKPVVADKDYRASFDKFWAAHPRKTAQGRAWQYWDRMTADERTKALEYAVAYAQVFNAAPDDRRPFFKSAAKWLEERCWEDDPFDWCRAANVNPKDVK